LIDALLTLLLNVFIVFDNSILFEHLFDALEYEAVPVKVKEHDHNSENDAVDHAKCLHKADDTHC
jgi:hypothetical protein